MEGITASPARDGSVLVLIVRKHIIRQMLEKVERKQKACRLMRLKGRCPLTTPAIRENYGAVRTIARTIDS